MPCPLNWIKLQKLCLRLRKNTSQLKGIEIKVKQCKSRTISQSHPNLHHNSHRDRTSRENGCEKSAKIRKIDVARTRKRG